MQKKWSCTFLTTQKFVALSVYKDDWKRRRKNGENDACVLPHRIAICLSRKWTVKNQFLFLFEEKEVSIFKEMFVTADDDESWPKRK